VYKRRELVPGTFFEYTYTPNDQFGLVAGVRADDNSLYGSFVTPRINMRYEPVKGTTIRFSAGKGQRTANVFAENNSVFASARKLDLQMNPHVAGYGLLPEIAWNKGISLDQKFNLFEHTATLGFDYFRNDFQNQVIVDLENPRLVQIYNLKGKSYSNSIQTELNMQPLDKLDIRLAYRYFQVFQTYNGDLLERPFIAKNRAFVSLDYATTNNWKFNYTITFNGKKRVTNTSANPSSLQLKSYSPSYTIMNAQVTKTFGKNHLNDLYE
jgi:outer membrane receptor for ferrienterochelin and colicin